MNNTTKGLLLGGVGALTIYFSTRYVKKKLGIYPKLEPFEENRVRRDDYGQLPSDSPLLVPVESVGTQQRVHLLVAKRLQALKDAAAVDGFTDIKVASGWRPHRWRSWDHYRDAMIKRYGSVAVGRGWVAYKSPHETGLAVDFGSHGLYPSSKTNAAQKRKPFYLWLVNNAHRFGFTPYKKEAWHWEVKVPQDAWATGEEFTSDFGVYV